MKKVILFEDSDDMVSRIHEPLEALLNKHDFELLIPSKEQLNSVFDTASETYENSLIKFIDDIEDIAFVVADRDLSKLLGGFSESSVSRVCEIKKIPFALYARIDRQDDAAEILFNAENRLDYQSEFKLVLNAANLVESKINLFCSQILDLVSGFERIRDYYTKTVFHEGESYTEGLFPSIANIVGNPAIEFKLKRFSIGNSSILPYNFLDKKKVEQLEHEGEDAKKRVIDSLVYLTGYWLHETVLKYPGPLVNKVAAASYLGVNSQTLRELDERNLLDKAKYSGPFSSYRNYWFVDKLDDLLFEVDCRDGIQFAEKYEIEAHPARCSVCGHEQAGYYCIVTEEAVCKSCSVGNISWIPSGANLCRVNKTDYDTYGPWAGW